MRLRIRRQFLRKAAIDETAADLVAHQADAGGDGDAQMRRIEVGDTNGAQTSGVAFGFEQPERVEPAWVGEGPRMELQEIDGLGLQPIAGTIDGGPHIGRRYGARFRHPLGKALHRRRIVRHAAPVLPATTSADP